MTQQTSPFLEGKFGWDYGEDGWNTGMDENLLKFSFMFDRNVDGVVSSLPTVVNGQSWFLTTDNRLYFAVGGTFYSSPTPKWFQFTVKSTGVVYQFNGTTATVVDNLSQLDTRLDAVEVTVSGLGTAAFEDVAYFATQGALDAASAQANNYTDTLRADLLSTASGKGALLVGKSFPVISDVPSLRVLAGRYSGDSAFLTGITAGSTLGAGPVVWDSLSTTADDNGTVYGSLPQGRWKRPNIDEYVDAQWFGVGNDGQDYTAQLQAAIAYAAATVGGSQGMSVRLPRGTIGITSTLSVPNRVGLIGANGRGTTIKAITGFTGSYMISGTNGTSSMFGSFLRDLHIDSRGFNLTAVVYSTAWQETCNMERVLIQADGTTANGVLYEVGNGGAAIWEVKDCEIFINSTAATRNGIRINQVSLVGGFLFIVKNTTIAGSSTNTLTRGVYMLNDSIRMENCHFEYTDTCLRSEGAGNIDVSSMTGSGNAVIDMVALGSGYTGKCQLTAILPNGATGNIVTNNVTGNHVAATGQRIATYTYPLAAFNAHVSAQIPNVTGNGTEYTVLFNTERFDLSGSFASGVFTAPESGKYQLSCAVKVTTPNTATTCVIKIVTSAKEYYVYRGSLANIRDGSGTVTLCGSVLADMALGATASVRITISGVGSNTVSVEPTESWFTGFKACW